MNFTNLNMTKIKEKTQHQNHESVNSSEGRNLILHNDDYNTFDYVIETLVDVCEHDVIQAEQCAHIVHFKGKCDVKRGSYEYLKPRKDELINKGLNATID
jgi:ATP-dependent Clp protease adaptor protein ClpS